MPPVFLCATQLENSLLRRRIWGAVIPAATGNKMRNHEQQLCDLLREDAWRFDVLRAVSQLGLPDCWVGAGFIRSYVWDRLCGLAAQKPEDVDVVYHYDGDIAEQSEKLYDEKLVQMMPDVPWSCKNQARMHIKAGIDTPYKNTEEGLMNWTETATAVAARMDAEGRLHVLAPFGLEDLFGMVVRPTPLFQKRLLQYRARLAQKRWDQRWPQLTFIE